MACIGQMSTVPLVLSSKSSAQESDMELERMAGEERVVVLEAEDHPQTLLGLMRDLYKQQALTDVTLVAEGISFHAHMVVLAAASPYFKDLLDTAASLHHQNTGYGLQAVDNVSAGTLEVLLEFVYTGRLQVTSSSVWKLVSAAAQLHITSAIRLCDNYQKGAVSMLPQCYSEWQPLSLDSPTDQIKTEPTNDPLPNTTTRQPGASTSRGSRSKTRKTGRTRKTKTRKTGRTRKTNNAAQCQKTRRTRHSGCSISNSQTVQTLSHSRKRKKVVLKNTSTKKRSKVKCSEKPVHKHKCGHCSQKFVHYSLLKLHQKIHRFVGGRLPAWCDFISYCGSQSCADSPVITRPTYSCRVCHRKFHLHALFVRHCQLHHRRCFKCKKCSLTLPTRIRLQKHCVLSHGESVDIRNYCVNKCLLCGRVFAHTHSLKTHLRTHAGADTSQKICRSTKLRSAPKNFHSYVCYICGETYQLRAFRQHLRNVHNFTTEQIKDACKHNKHTQKSKDEERNKCTECSTQCKSAKELQLHMKTDHPDLSFPCRYCNYSTRLRTMLKKHMAQRHGKDSWSRACEMCDKTFNTKYHLIRHKFAIHGVSHPSLREYKCEGCDYVTYSDHMLKQHQRRHSDERPFTCEICAKSVKTAHVLEAHIKKVHLDIRPFICDQCGAAYGEEHELKLHMGRHDQVKEFRCEFCNYCSHLRGELRRHLYVVHNIKLDQKMQVYECGQCDYRTTHKNRYHDHQRRHRDIRDIKCPHCDKTFSTMTSQRGHIKAVHKPKHLKCTYCGYATSLISQMKTHVRVIHTHPNHKPFKCAHCNFHCATSGNCRKHIMQRHKGLEVKWIRVAEKTPNLDQE